MLQGRNKNSHWNKKMAYSQGHSHKDKTPVVGMIQWDSLIVLQAHNHCYPYNTQ